MFFKCGLRARLEKWMLQFFWCSMCASKGSWGKDQFEQALDRGQKLIHPHPKKTTTHTHIEQRGKGTVEVYTKSSKTHTHTYKSKEINENKKFPQKGGGVYIPGVYQRDISYHKFSLYTWERKWDIDSNISTSIVFSALMLMCLWGVNHCTVPHKYLESNQMLIPPPLK